MINYLIFISPRLNFSFPRLVTLRADKNFHFFVRFKWISGGVLPAQQQWDHHHNRPIPLSHGNLTTGSCTRRGTFVDKMHLARIEHVPPVWHTSVQPLDQGRRLQNNILKDEIHFNYIDSSLSCKWIFFKMHGFSKMTLI